MRREYLQALGVSEAHKGTMGTDMMPKDPAAFARWAKKHGMPSNMIGMMRNLLKRPSGKAKGGKG